MQMLASRSPPNLWIPKPSNALLYANKQLHKLADTAHPDISLGVGGRILDSDIAGATRELGTPGNRCNDRILYAGGNIL